MNAPQLTLYAHPQSPFCLAVEIALYECRLTFRHLLLDPKKPKAKSFLQKSPFGRVPVLVEQQHGGLFSVSETPAVLLYLAERIQNTTLTLSDKTSKSEIFAWMSLFDSDWGELVLQVCHQPSLREDSNEVLLLERQLKTLDAYLSLRAFLVGAYSVADIFALPFLVLLEHCPILPLAQFPHLMSWCERLRAQHGYQTLLGPPGSLC